jgi:hypothetical protein
MRHSHVASAAAVSASSRDTSGVTGPIRLSWPGSPAEPVNVRSGTVSVARALSASPTAQLRPATSSNHGPGEKPSEEGLSHEGRGSSPAPPSRAGRPAGGPPAIGPLPAARPPRAGPPRAGSPGPRSPGAGPSDPGSPGARSPGPGSPGARSPGPGLPGARSPGPGLPGAGATAWPSPGPGLAGFAGPSAGGLGGGMPRISRMSTCARSKSIPPGAPLSRRAVAMELIRVQAALACAAGRNRPSSDAVPSGSPTSSTRACRSACLRLRSAAAGSTDMTARRSEAHS